MYRIISGMAEVCKLCGKAPKDILRHIRNFHKVQDSYTLPLIDLLRTGVVTKRDTCTICTHQVVNLAKHLRRAHKMVPGAEDYRDMVKTQKAPVLDVTNSPRDDNLIVSFEQWLMSCHGGSVEENRAGIYARQAGQVLGVVGRDWMSGDALIVLESIPDVVPNLLVTRAATSVKTILFSWIKFLDYLGGRHVEKEKTAAATAVTRRWIKSLKGEVYRKRGASRDKNASTMLTTDEMKRYLSSKRVKVLETSLAGIGPRESRDYLMTRILLHNGQRPEAVYKMCVDDVNRAKAVMKTVMVVTLTNVKTKTSHSHGPLEVFIQLKVFDRLKEYLAEKRTNPHGRPEVFLSKTGHPGNTLPSLGVSAEFKRSGIRKKTTSKNIRVGLVSHFCPDMNPVDRRTLADVMHHSVGVQREFYQVGDEQKRKSSILEKMVQEVMGKTGPGRPRKTE